MKTEAQTKIEALILLMQEAALDRPSARRYPALKRSLRTIGIEENSDEWHRVLSYVGYHDSQKREPYAWALPKPRPKSFRIQLAKWERRGGRIHRFNTDACQLSDYAREAGVKLDGYKTAREADAAGRKMTAKPNSDGIYPVCKAEPVHE